MRQWRIAMSPSGRGATPRAPPASRPQQPAKGFPRSKHTSPPPSPSHQLRRAGGPPAGSVGWRGKKGREGGTTSLQIRSEDRGGVPGASSTPAANPPPARPGRRSSASAPATHCRGTGEPRACGRRHISRRIRAEHHRAQRATAAPRHAATPSASAAPPPADPDPRRP